MDSEINKMRQQKITTVMLRGGSDSLAETSLILDERNIDAPHAFVFVERIKSL